MNEAEIVAATKITKKMMETAVSSHYNIPVEDNEYYYSKRKKKTKSLNFSIIKSKLEGKKYKTIAEWRSDFYKVFDIVSNSLDFIEFKQMNEYLEAKFEKYLSEMFVENWSQRIISLQIKLNKLVQNPPIRPSIYQTAAQKINGIKDNSMFEEVKKIINRYHPNYLSNCNGEINLSLLEPEIILEINQILS